MSSYGLQNFSQSNLWAQVRAFAGRGGFVNGLDPSRVGKVWFVNANTTTNRALLRGPVGSDGNAGLSPLAPFATMAKALTKVGSYDVIVVDGVIREQVVAPLLVYDVTIIGSANSPRQATSGGVATGGGATWLPPASPTALTPLLEIRAAGWIIANIAFTPHTSSAGIRLTRSAVVDTTDASHCRISNCLFGANGGATQIGIEDNGGCGFVTIENCRFQDLTGTAIKSLNTAAAVSRSWRITGNRFNGNTNAIGVSLTESLIDNNYIRQTANDTNFKVNLVAVAAQGSLNQVINNVFSDVAANVTIAKGYKPGTTDVWRNYVTDTAAYIITVPA